MPKDDRRTNDRRADKARKRKNRRKPRKTPRKRPVSPRSANTKEHPTGVYHTSFGIVFTDEDPTTLQFRPLAGAKILRPSVRTELALRAEAERNLRATVGAGGYTTRDDINGILRSHFAFFDGEVDRVTPRIASRGMVEFVLHLYDESCKVDDAAKAGRLSPNDEAYWAKLGQTYRRALKYLAEQSVLAEHGESQAAPDAQVLDLTERALCCAEEAVDLAAMSDQTFGLFPDRSTLNVAPPGERVYVSLDVAPPDGSEFDGRIRRDLAVRGRYLKLDYPLFDAAMRDQALGPAFEAVFGLPYAQCFGLLAETINGAEPPPTGFPVPFVLRQQIIGHFVSGVGMTLDAAGRLLDGFTVSSKKMREEGRALFKPKQEHRAYRRGFFAFPHPDGSHLAWSKGMARECLYFLMRDLAFKQLPPEWDDPTLRAATDRLSRACGTAFERHCHALLAERGFPVCGSFKNGIGVGAGRLAIPPRVGEIDCLAYSPALRLLLVLECKLVMPKTDPARFRDDVSKFTGDDGYFAQHRRKCDWIRANLPAVTAALATIPNGPAEVTSTRVGTALVTLYPTFASHEPDAPTCVSAGELFADLDANGGWPNAYDGWAV